MSFSQVRYAHSQVTNRGPTRILYLLLVVDENRYVYGRKMIVMSAEQIRPSSSWRVGNSVWAKTNISLRHVAFVSYLEHFFAYIGTKIMPDVGMGSWWEIVLTLLKLVGKCITWQSSVGLLTRYCTVSANWCGLSIRTALCAPVHTSLTLMII